MKRGSLLINIYSYKSFKEGIKRLNLDIQKSCFLGIKSYIIDNYTDDLNALPFYKFANRTKKYLDLRLNTKFNKRNKRSIYYWLWRGYKKDIALELMKEYSYSLGTGYIDISTFDKFKNVLKERAKSKRNKKSYVFNVFKKSLLPNIYISFLLNTERVGKITVLKKVGTGGNFDDMFRLFFINRRSKGRRASTSISIEFWESLGYSKKYAIKKVSKLQKARSDLNFDKWRKNTNLTDIEIKKEISLLQSRRSIQNTNRYDGKSALATSTVSQEEINFFKLLIKAIRNVIHEGFIVDVSHLDHINNNYFIYDGFIKIKDKHILIEYDGSYWHDEEADEHRDAITLSVSKNTLGIIRFLDKHVKNKNNNIIKDLKNGIKNIKSNKNRIIRYREGK